MTFDEQNALEAAKRYLRTSSFSKKSLINQLEHDKYPHGAAEYVVNNMAVDWYDQAVKTGNRYLKIAPFSRERLFEQLLHDGFNDDEAENAIITITGLSPFDTGDVYVTADATANEHDLTAKLPTSEPVNVSFCGNCGNKIINSGNFCQYCGFKLR